LKAKHPPQTTRCTDWKPGSALSAGRLESRTPWAAWSEALSLSADHLHRHSRATVANRTPGQISTAFAPARASPAAPRPAPILPAPMESPRRLSSPPPPGRKTEATLNRR